MTSKEDILKEIYGRIDSVETYWVIFKDCLKHEDYFLAQRYLESASYQWEVIESLINNVRIIPI